MSQKERDQGRSQKFTGRERGESLTENERASDTHTHIIYIYIYERERGESLTH